MIIPGFSQYDISEDGIITEVSTGRTVKQHVYSINGKPYKRVAITDDTHVKCTPNVIRLLALTYLEKPGKYDVATAKDGNSLNTTADNVEWLTRREVMQKTWDSGIVRRPRKSLCCTEETKQLVYDTLLAYDTPVTMTELSYELQIPYSVVRYSMEALIYNKYVRKVKNGYEVKR